MVCFEIRFDPDQAFGRIYPSPTYGTSVDRPEQGWLDESARELIQAWKAQRRREGLADCIGPDGGISIEELWATQRDMVPAMTGLTPHDRDSDALKHARPIRRNTAPQLDDPKVELGNRRPIPQLLRGISLDTSMALWLQSPRDAIPVLPSKLSDALRLIKGASGGMRGPVCR